METQLMSLAIIMLVAFLAPLVASAIPGKPIPEVVFLVFAGAILGPNMAQVIITDGQALTMVSDLGLAFLFLMAGYEIEPKDFVTKTGLHALLSWICSFGLALLLVWFIGDHDNASGWLAFAITLTTTAYGTLAPIMRERGINGTRVGKAVTTYGSLGEILPVLAMAFLLSSRSPMATAITLAIFLVLCVVVAALPQLARRLGTRAWKFLNDNAGTGSRPMIRMTVLILVFLIAISAMFELDLVLGAFAAGFIIRAIFPNGNKQLEEGIESIGNGFLVPAFFVISGATIDLSAAFASPLILIGDILLMVLVRGCSVAVSLHVNPETRSMTWRETFSTASYCTMALPLIVAVTSVAVSNGAMTQEIASILVTAGAITVLVIPIVTSLVRVTSDAIPAISHAEAVPVAVEAEPISENAADRRSTPGDFAHRRLQELRQAQQEFADVHQGVLNGKSHMSSMEYLAVADASLRAARLKAFSDIAKAASEAAKQPEEVREARLAALKKLVQQQSESKESKDIRAARLNALAAIANAAAAIANEASAKAATEETQGAQNQAQEQAQGSEQVQDQAKAEEPQQQAQARAQVQADADAQGRQQEQEHEQGADQTGDSGEKRPVGE